MPKKSPSTSPVRSSAAQGMIGGHLRRLRRERGWSLEFLAEASGVSRSMLSQIERDRANPTLAVALRIAQALGLALDDLAQTDAGQRTIEVISGSDPSQNCRVDDECRIRTLSPLHREKDVEFYEIRLKPQAELRSPAHFRGTREYAALLKGTLRVESGKDRRDLEAGDSASYPADQPHALVNTGRAEAVISLVVIYR